MVNYTENMNGKNMDASVEADNVVNQPNKRYRTNLPCTIYKQMRM